MAAFLSLLRRNYTIFYPQQPAKSEDAIKIGLLGASTIAPMAIIIPAKSHPEVIIAAIAARDENRARAYAEKHGIDKVHQSYQDLIDDPSIEAVYIPLPNGLHYEWTIKTLKAGKHVLLEKPSTSNATEAASLFRHDILKQPKAPVLLEAFHSRFHPAWQTFLSCLDPPNIKTAHCVNIIPRNYFPNTDIRFIYDLSGGALMDLGTYNVLFLRQIFGTEPEECVEATPRMMPEGFDQKCDQAMKAKWRFPNGGFGSMEADLSARGRWGLPRMGFPMCEVVHNDVLIKDQNSGDDSGEEHMMGKTVTMWNAMMPVFWHRIDITEQHTLISKDRKVIKTWTVKQYRKAYTYTTAEVGTQIPSFGEESWSTYRYQLEEFVNRIKGRKGSGLWMDGEDSVKQSEMLDSAYRRAGLALRPTSSYLNS